MKRGWKILLVVLGVVAVLLAVNTIVISGQTKNAEVTIDGGEILELPVGDVQVLEEGPATPRAQVAPPIVLIHCYACSLHWWDEMAPLLVRRGHRVIRIDLLGHGGSEKPSSGYEISEQAALVASALNELDVQGAVVVGHSMGFSVATALAEQASQLVDRLVNIDEGPSMDYCELPFEARIAYWPVIGEAFWRVTPDFLVEDGYASAFAPDVDVSEAFPNPDQVVNDLHQMTFTSYEDAHDGNDSFVEAVPLDERLKRLPVPLLSIFGSEDQICDPERSQEAYAAVPGARVATIDGAGHSPNVENPRETAALIEEFAQEAGDEFLSPPGGGSGGDGGRPRQGGEPNRGSGK